MPCSRYRCVLALPGGLAELATDDPEACAAWVSEALRTMRAGDVLDVYRNGRNIGARLAARLMKANNAAEIQRSLIAA